MLIFMDMNGISWVLMDGNIDIHGVGEKMISGVISGMIMRYTLWY